jgi:hypothetical protein
MQKAGHIRGFVTKDLNINVLGLFWGQKHTAKLRRGMS